MSNSEKEITHDLLRAAQRAILTARPGAKQSARRRRIGTGLWSRPFHSESLGVNPDQIPTATKALRAAGVMADFDSSGRLVVTSDKQYREAAKSCGLFTGRNGYGGGLDEDGGRVRTGRENEKEKQRFRAAVASGEYDF
jgi:hypothetical protein